MIIGVPKEIKTNEKRVSLLPHLVKDIISLGHNVVVQNGAGLESGISNNAYENEGAKILPSIEDVYRESDIIVKVKEPLDSELDLIKDSQIIFTFFHFAADKNLLQKFISTNAIAVAYETVEDQKSTLPLLTPMSEIAGRMAVQNGAKYLEATQGGKGILLSGVPGVSPATVTIIGGGVVGLNAAKLAAGLGAKVNILDIDMNRLRYLDDIMPSNVFTHHSNSHTINKLLPKTDLLIGGVLVPGSKAPNIISKKMLSLMKKGSVIVDVAVDQGGCIETTRPTTHENPIYTIDGIVHYCVANMPGAVPQTSTVSLTNCTSSYVLELLKEDFTSGSLLSNSIMKGVNVFKGNITHRGLADSFGLPYVKIESAMSLK
tara:strand:+ start:774 stop:1895 length:1122 start_codon:yes stop_codon:yes gene_type:complete